MNITTAIKVLPQPLGPLKETHADEGSKFASLIKSLVKSTKSDDV